MHPLRKANETASRPFNFTRLLVTAVLLLCLSAVTAAPALALETHVPSTSFGEPGSGDGQLSLGRESGVAVNDETHDVYVADAKNHRIDEFTQAGAFIRAFGADVGGTGVDVCTSGCQAGTPGSAPGQLEAPTYLAVDNSAGPSKGDIYVADPGESIVTKFSESGTLVESWAENGQLSASTATATGTLETGSTTVSSLASLSGAFFVGEPISAPGILAETTITAVTPGSLEISNPATASGPATLLARAPLGPASSSFGLGGAAVDPEGHLWVFGSEINAATREQPGRVFEFTPGAESLRAWLTGHNINVPTGLATDSAGNLYLPIDRTVNQFTPAGFDVGPVDQGPESFQFAAFSLDASANQLYTWGDSTDESGLLSAAVVNHYLSSCDPGGACAATDTFGLEQLTVGNGGLAVDPATHTVYVAQSSSIAVFTGPVIVPDLATEAASEVAPRQATLHGHLDPAGGTEVTSCAFQYVTDAAFSKAGREGKGFYSDLSSGGSVPCAEGASFAAPTAVHASLTGLDTGTVYHYRLLVSNAAGYQRLGQTKSFTTPTHVFTATFAGSGANALSNPSAVAVDEGSHDVWVTDPANHRVEKFSAAGAFILMIGKGVDLTTGGNLCTAASGHSCQPGVSATSPGAFKSPDQLAVDNSAGPSAGDLYVADIGDALVSKFDSSGNLLASWGDAASPADGQLDGSSDQNGNGPFVRGNGNGLVIGGLGVDPVGNLWVEAEFEKAGDNPTDLYEFDQSGRWVTSFGYPAFSAPRAGIGLDSAGRLYAATEQAVIGFNPAGVIERSFRAGNNSPTGLAVDSVEDVYVDSGSLVYHYTPSACISNGECLAGDTFGSPQLSAARGLAVDSTNEDVFVANSGAGNVAVFDGLGPAATTGPTENLGHGGATLTGHVDPLGRADVAECRFQYVTEAAFQKTGFADLSSGGAQACDQPTPISAPTDVSTTLSGLTTNTTYRYRLFVGGAGGTAAGSARSFEAVAVTGVNTEAATDITNTSATLHGTFNGEEALATEYLFEYGTSTHYGHKTPPGAFPGTAGGAGTQSQHIGSPIEGLLPGTTYHFRLLATDSFGTTRGEDETFTTAQPPSIDALSSSGLTATSADLNAKLEPHEYTTTYRFEYGTTTAYGETAPVPDGEISEGLSTAHNITAHLSGLQGTTYHFRLVAENKWGTTTSEDQTFEFFPPSCPNTAVRQQTSSAYLPDCRAYELVSPQNANGTLLFSGGPNTGLATSPARLAYVANYSAPPEATDTIGAAGDLYVATRTNDGWVSHYIGLPGNQTGCMGGPPTDPASHGSTPNEIQNRVFTDPSMSRLLDFEDGNGIACWAGGNGTGDANFALDPPSNAPYLWASEGSLLARLPSGLGSLPGAEASFVCPLPEPQSVVPHCAGEVTASPDLSHLIFSSNNFSFATGGLTTVPGSAYEEDLSTGAIELISSLPGGGPIPQDPSYAGLPGIEGGPGGEQEFLRFPAVSTDGSHVLISTATEPTPGCPKSTGLGVCARFAETPVHLYMRVGAGLGITYEIAEGRAVDYVGMTADGSRVYFTSEEHLTGEDPNHGGASLFMWSQKGEEEGHPLTLISRPNPGSPAAAGDTEDCEASWTAKCGVVPYSGRGYAASYGGRGGDGISDTAIASRSGDIYFYSPEQLDGDRGVPGQQNLYDYRGGELHFVATFKPHEFCETDISGYRYCTDGPIARLQVTADGTHMAFVTPAPITSYENAGHLEMYSYTPADGGLVCDSCRPDGRPATANVGASQDGLFLTEDGRTFFSTSESLVPRDTNQAVDVYEFSGGRPRLITPGTGTATVTGLTLVSLEEVPGLIGVSADGTDVYFSTYDSLISEDHNGNFLKFYDARTGGGFLQAPPGHPCAAAEECHGPGTEAPQSPTRGTAATLSGGNVTANPHAHRKRHHRTSAAHHHRRTSHEHGGKRR